MLTTLIVCLANCSTPTSLGDELGMLSGRYVELCHAMHHLKAAHCPAVEAPVLVQCVTDVERELPLRYTADFRNGVRLLQRRFAAELPAQTEESYRAQLQASGGDGEAACQALAAENRRQRFRDMQLIRKLSKPPLR